ncbi:MAG: type II secretion system protein [Fusobacteriaceae bacterium]|nr:type II secretion system protein [Fusobacteriaceae bacterium]MBN2838175.1 type II secretion system protein [Fusobacteriaceae bacterium]
MNKKKAFTLMELMVAIAILVIFVGMMAPMIKSLTDSNKKTQDMSDLDINIGRTIDVYKRAVRSSQVLEGDNWSVTGTAIYLTNSITGDTKVLTTTATAIVINVPKQVSTTSNSFVDEKVIFYYDSASRRIMLNSTTTTGASATITTSNPVELVKNVQAATFGYSNNVVTIYMRIQTDRNDINRFREIRDSAVTRINFDNE